MRAKSINADMLKHTGARVAEVLKREKVAGLAETEVAYFPDFGIFGGEMVLERVTDLSIGQLMKISSKISHDVLSRSLDVKPALAIKDNILIFGGELVPDLAFRR